MSSSTQSETSDPHALLPRLSWKTRVGLSIFRVVTQTAFHSDGTVNRRLLKVLETTTPANPNPINGVKSQDITVLNQPSRNIWYRLFTPTTTTTKTTTQSLLPLIVFFHGGGFTQLSPAAKSYDAVCRRFARQLNAIVASVEYRLAPEHRFPCQYDDGFEALCYIEKNPPENADVSKCFLAGDSAGGNLAHQMAVRAGQAGLKRIKVIGLISIQPYFGGEERTDAEIRLVNTPIITTARTDWAWRAFLPEGSNRDHWATNVSGPNAVDISGLEYPSTLLIVGGLDPLQDWQRRYFDWLKRSGKDVVKIEYPNMFHAFYIFPEVPHSDNFIRDVKDFMHKQLLLDIALH